MKQQDNLDDDNDMSKINKGDIPLIDAGDRGSICNDAFLPCKAFPNYFCYICYCYRYHIMLQIFLLFIIIFIFYPNRDTDGGLIFLILSLLAYFFYIVIIIVNSTFPRYDMELECELVLLKEITIRRPAFDMGQWNTIAATLNRIAHETDTRIKPFSFYNGSDCSLYFRKILLSPYLERREGCVNSQLPENFLQQQAENATEREQEIVNQLPIMLSTLKYKKAMTDIMDPYLERAAASYQESLESYWTSMSNSASMV